MEFTTGALASVVETADWVAIGTSSPTWSRAVWLSRTISMGEEMIFTSVISVRALRTARKLEDA